MLHKAITTLHLVELSSPLIIWTFWRTLNPLNAELNPSCHLLALLTAHHILHVSRKRVNVTCFLLPAAPCLPILGSFEAIIIVQWAQKDLDNTGRSHRISTHTGCYWLQNYWCQESFPQLPKYHNFWNICIQIKEILHYMKKYSTVYLCFNTTQGYYKH
jgi:hypothetical protein